MACPTYLLRHVKAVQFEGVAPVMLLLGQKIPNITDAGTSRAPYDKFNYYWI